MESQWHDEVESAQTVDETVACVRRVLRHLTTADSTLPRFCRASCIASDDDVDDLTQRLAPLRRETEGTPDLEPLFHFVLHASMHIAHLNRVRAAAVPVPWRSAPQMRQMG
ncbi:MAG TPA: hypothetical protein VH040_09640 [Usitatibacter sp.]|jgi:hypothetical protein|nr:hypothetical protein [Usitatibacter sp.]